MHKFTDRRGAPRSHAPRSHPPRTEPPGPAQINPQSIGYGLYATPRNTGQMDSYRARPFFLQDLDRPINDFDWYDLLRFARQLFAQLGNLSGAIVQKAAYAVGDAWKPQFAGTQTAWGEEAREWLLNEWYPNCDQRGTVFDFNTNLLLSSIAWDVDGDDLMVLTDDGDTGFPKLRFYSAWSMSSGSGKSVTGNDNVKGGPFDGAALRNGIIIDNSERMIGVRLRGSSEEQPLDVPISKCQLLFEPQWRNQWRGIPPIGHSLLDWLDIQDIDVFLKRLVKKASSVGLKWKTLTGEPGPSSDLLVERNAPATDNGQTAPLDLRIERRMGGEDFYFTAGTDEDVEALNFNTPSPNTEAFIQRLERRCFAAIGWYFELIDPGALKGACVRLIQDQVRHSIFLRQRSLRKRAKRAIQYALAVAMERRLISRNHADGDFLKWEFNLPAQITVDQGYDDQADQQNFRLGMTTLAAVCEKKGKQWEQNRAQRVKENLNLLDAAAQLVQHAAAAGQDLTFREALDLMQYDGPNQRVPLLEQEYPSPGAASDQSAKSDKSDQTKNK